MGGRERFVDRGETQLSGAILAGDTTITVVDGSVLPPEGDFRIRLGNQEQVLVTARAGNVLTCVRGYGATTPTGFPDGTQVVQNVTEASLNKWLADSAPGAGQDSGRPAFRLVDDTGAPLTSSDYRSEQENVKHYLLM